MQNNKMLIIVLDKHFRFFIISLFIIYFCFYSKIHTYNNRLKKYKKIEIIIICIKLTFISY